MQCVQCWNDFTRDDIKCFTCNELFCSQKCLDKHELEVKQDNERIEFEDNNPELRENRYELANKYPWER